IPKSTRKRKLIRTTPRLPWETLQQWYNHHTGLWTSYSPSWWQSANALTTLIDMVQIGSPKAKKIADMVIPHTFQAAGAFNVREGHRLKRAAADDNKKEEKNPYSNGYYDDMAAYDVTGDKTYLSTAETLFADTTMGWGTNCSAEGMWWDKRHTHIDPIADTLFIEVAAWLANRVQADKKIHYADWAVRAWDGFRRSPMYVSGEHYVTAGISVQTCRLSKNPHGYTYSNGALVSGLVALSIATGNRDYLEEAHKVAQTIMKIMSKDGFKGVFMRGLMRLHAASPRPEYREFAQQCADSIWDKNRQGAAELGPDWNGPFHGPANASPHSSAMDGLVAAWRMTK
ncbi:glycoside hydrolase family 76 protein, partial [Apiospora hydei]